MKMKKLIAVLLSCVLLFTLAVPALGESGYEVLKILLSQSGGEELYHLGEPVVMPGETNDNIIRLGYSGEDCILVLSGINSSGESELCGWLEVDVIHALAVFVATCVDWDTVSGLCDSGYTLLLAWKNGDETLFIDSAEEAAMFVEAVEDLLE